MTVVFLLTIIIFIFIGSITAEIQGCNTTTRDFWPVNCDERGSLIIPDGNNQTSLATAIYNIVYNTNTSNSSVWTPARRRQFDSYWNSIRNVIWSSNGTISSKINQIIQILMAYSANDCEWQGMFLAETKLEQIGQCIWGTLSDFIVCGNLSSNYSIPTTVAPPNCVGNSTFPPSSTPISGTSWPTEPNESSTFPNESTISMEISSTLPSTMPSSVSFETSESSSVSESTTGNVTESMETTIGTSTLEQESTTSSVNLTESSTNPTENQSSSSIPTESSSTDIDQTSTSSNNVMESTSSAETTGSSFGTTQVEESTTTSFEGGTNSTTAEQSTSESTFGTTTNATETTSTISA